MSTRMHELDAGLAKSRSSVSKEKEGRAKLNVKYKTLKADYNRIQQELSRANETLHTVTANKTTLGYELTNARAQCTELRSEMHSMIGALENERFRRRELKEQLELVQDARCRENESNALMIKELLAKEAGNAD